jgi:hypothetical protein
MIAMAANGNSIKDKKCIKGITLKIKETIVEKSEKEGETSVLLQSTN